MSGRSGVIGAGGNGLAVQRVRVAVIGAGPAGLTAATALAGTLGGGAGGAAVHVLEREERPGGIPRHSDHPGYGVRDLRRVLTGPAYAARLADAAERAGAVLRTGSMVTGWDGVRRLLVTSPRGRVVVEADAVVLATGARERPRAARLIPGDRPAGVYTTGQLQQLVHLHHEPVGRAAVVVGAELVSWSAVMTLRESGCRTVAMVSAFARAESPVAVGVAGRLGLGVPVATRARVRRIIGRGRVEAVEIEHLDTGARRLLACDTVITTGDWIPDSELARAAGLDLDAATRGPVVDTALRTSAAGVFAAGNVIHPVDTADVAALDGRHVAEQVRNWLRDTGTTGGWRPDGVRLEVRAPLRWVTPQRWLPRVSPARNRLLLWTDALVARPEVTARQGDRVIGRRRLSWPAAPGRMFRVPAGLLREVDPAAGPVTISVDGAGSGR